MLVYFVCEKCKSTYKKFFHDYKLIPDDVKCLKCKKGVADRQIAAPNSKHVISIDDFRSNKPIEVSADVVIAEQEKAINGQDN